MTSELLKLLFDGAALFLSVLAMVTAVVRTRNSKLDERLKTGADRMDRHEGRIARLEQKADAAPTK